MQYEFKLLAASLEMLLVNKFRPTFLALTIDEETGTIQVVMSCIKFNYQTITERTISVFTTIYKEMPNIIEDNLIVLQCFNTVEMNKVLDDMFKDLP